jgi:type VI secretion system secreted protein VgrG
VSLSGREALSSLYRFTVQFKSASPDIDCQAMIGERCAVELETDRRGQRWLSGQMIDFAAVGHEGRHWVYEATLAPRLWHASRRADFRIWQNQSVPDILYQVLGENAVRFDMRLKARYKSWTYLVQYRETDLSFICRQLEHEGIFFWFEHAADGETLVLADHLSAHPVFPGYGSMPYYSGLQTRPDRDHFDAWRLTRRVEPGRLIHTDYDFERPAADLTTEHADPRGHLFDHYTRFHYPGDYIDPGDGSQYAANTLERLQRQQETLHLSGRVRGAAPGHRLTLTEHPRADQNRELTLVAVSYDIADNDYEGAAGSTASRFRVDVEALPADRPFRPPLATPKPRTRGVETAVVVGPPGEEIHTDEYGRVKVHFHWDRYGQRDGTDTCWIRVASPWAGSNFGAIHLPRIGQEVIVDFEHGDPDRPIITGRVYNAEQMPPWPLPANQTQSGILTRSSKGGAPGEGLRDGAGDANALRFEDKKGAEQVWFHAQKDYLTEVENDESKWVGNDRHKEIDRDETTQVHRHRTETVDGNETITIHQNRNERVDLDEKVDIGDNQTFIVGKTRTKRVGKNESDTIGRMKTEHIGIGFTQNVGVFRMTNIGVAYNLNVGMAMMTNTGMIRMDNVGMNHSHTVGKNHTHTVGTQYQLTVGSGGGASGPPDTAMNIVAPSGGGASEGGGGGGGGSSITMDGESITLKVGASTLVMKADGTIQIDGKDLSLLASSKLLESAADGVQITGGPSVVVKAGTIDLN